MLLSFIVPFFNSEKKSTRLLKTLSSVDQSDIEIILIDDGSTDNTYEVLKDFKKNASNKNVKIIKQENKGPGGARNAGLRIAKGKYVWFVDSDDDIKVEAIDVVRQNFEKEYDFIDFNIESALDTSNTMGLEVGEYVVDEESRLRLLRKFGSIWSKVLRKEFLLDNDIFYPEYCFYEDNLLQFMYPFFVESFLKVEIIGYTHHLEFESITRTKVNPRTFDRLRTAISGIEKGLKLTNCEAEVRVLEKMFINKYLLITTEQLLTKKPSNNWMTTWRVMKSYRDVAKKLDIKCSPFEVIKETTYNQKLKFYFSVQWTASFLITRDQTEYFEAIHKKAWN